MKKMILLFALVVILTPALHVLAKGEFDYLLVKGPGITGEIDITDPALTHDFFAFADFSQGSIEAPSNPGQGYQIFRIYVKDNKDQPFDQLHYYPYSGYVFYDGLLNGSSEYDGKWFAANPSANGPFRAALAKSARLTWVTFAVLIILLAVFYIAYHSKAKGAGK